MVPALTWMGRSRVFPAGMLKPELSGVVEMTRLPGALFVIDIKKEEIAVKEARKLGIPVVAIVDTNCDPSYVDYPIPANDDAIKSIQVITKVIADAVIEGSQKSIAETERGDAGSQHAMEEEKIKETRHQK